jgi:hypothetical protein
MIGEYVLEMYELQLTYVSEKDVEKKKNKKRKR